MFFSSHTLTPQTGVGEDKPTFVISNATGGFGGCPTVWVAKAVNTPKGSGIKALGV
jgi:hypothetical protein